MNYLNEKSEYATKNHTFFYLLQSSRLNNMYGNWWINKWMVQHENKKGICKTQAWIKWIITNQLQYKQEYGIHRAM